MGVDNSAVWILTQTDHLAAGRIVDLGADGPSKIICFLQTFQRLSRRYRLSRGLHKIFYAEQPLSLILCVQLLLKLVCAWTLHLFLEDR